MTVTVASKALKVGERGIYHAQVVLSQGTDESIETVTFRNILGVRKRDALPALPAP